jgi:hypothetical protein
MFGFHRTLFQVSKIQCEYHIKMVGIYTELQNCMYQMAHGPCLSQSLLLLPITIPFSLVMEG